MLNLTNLKRGITIGLGLFVVFIGFGFCSRLPITRPADFEVTYSEDGGMVPYGRSIHASAEEASYSIHKHGVNIETIFIVIASYIT